MPEDNSDLCASKKGGPHLAGALLPVNTLRLLQPPPPRPSPVTICPSHPILTEGMGSNDGPTPRWGSPVGPLEVVVVAFSEFDYLSDFFLEEPFLHYFCIQLRVEVPCYPPPLCSPGPVCTNHQVLHMQAVPPVVPLTLRHILSWGPSPPQPSTSV